MFESSFVEELKRDCVIVLANKLWLTLYYLRDRDIILHFLHPISLCFLTIIYKNILTQVFVVESFISKYQMSLVKSTKISHCGHN